MKRLTTLFAIASICICASAQQNVGFRQGAVISPEVNEDHTVTFRVNAPNATEVTVFGDWAADKGIIRLEKNSKGIWENTTTVLPSEMYTYRVIIDGIAGIDPSNPFTRRDVGNIFSIFYVPDGPADYYLVQDVPHGNVTQTWYESKGLETE